MVAVPELTDSNAATVTTAKTWNVANELLGAELNWSSLKAREDKRNLEYQARISSVADTRAPELMLAMVAARRTGTHFSTKTEELSVDFEC